MSKKMRIVISCILVVLAFGAGIAAFIHANGDVTQTANADGEAVYFVDASGKIEVPVEPEPAGTLANRTSRGSSAENPFFVLEIVPYDREAEFGYHISGCEPIDMELAAWYGKDMPTQLYDSVDKVYTYWEEEVPENFPTSDSTFKKTVTQLGTMKKVTDNSGTYGIDGVEYIEFETIPEEYTGITYKLSGTEYVEDENGKYIERVKFVEKENGEYVWTPLSQAECEALKDSNEEYTHSLHEFNADDETKTAFANKVYYEADGKEYTHKNLFVKESVGLAYKMVNGVRKKIGGDDDSYTAAERAELEAMELAVKNFSKNCIVYTVTPEELNINLGLIERADMIYIKGQLNYGSFKTYNEDSSLYRRELFEHADATTKVKNATGATFATNLLDWDAAVKIYEAATNTIKRVPVIMDTKSYNAIQLNEECHVPRIFGDGGYDKKDDGGTSNNMYKLFLLLNQMPSEVLNSLYGAPSLTDATGVFTSQDTGVLKKDGTPLKTGVFNFNRVDYIKNSSGALGYVNAPHNKFDKGMVSWNAYTLVPWVLVPDSTTANSGSFLHDLDLLEIKSQFSFYQYNSGGSQSSLQGATYLYQGSMQMSTGFVTEEGVENDQYGYQVYDFFDSINGSSGEPTTITAAEILYYLLNGINGAGPAPIVNKNYKVLELQPSPIYIDSGVGNGTNASSIFWETFITSYTNTIGSVTVDRMTTAELIGKNVEYLSEYDLIYIGLNKDADDVTMKFTSGTNFIYAHTGPMVTLDADKTAMFGWLKAGGTNRRAEITNSAAKNIERQFVYSGNDITRLVKEKLIAYGDKGYPIVFANGFFSIESPSSPSHVENEIDHNSYIYDLAAKVGQDNYLYMKALESSTVGVHMLEATKLRNALRKSAEIAWTNLVTPNIYNVNADPDSGDTPQASDYLPGREMQFTFDLTAPTATKYRVDLYVDLNGDGKHTDNEKLQDTDANFVIRNVTNGNVRVTNGNLVGGYKYSVTRSSIEDRVGSVCWKLDLLDESGKICLSKSGVSAIKAQNASEKEDIEVLQIISKDRQMVYLPMASEVDPSGTVNITDIPDSENRRQRSQWFYDDTKDLKDFNITFTRIKEEDLIDELVDNASYLNAYDMIVLGFADAYNGVSAPQVLDAIEIFRSNGKAILYTHDTSSIIGYSSDTSLTSNFSWGAAITERFRDAFGMDRYDILGCDADVDKKTVIANGVGDRADVAFKPSTSEDSVIMTSTATGGSSYMLAQGMTDGILYRHTVCTDDNLKVNKITEVNQGGITEYPYTISNTIDTAVTHPQYYQLDLETDRIVVWYALGGENGEGEAGNSTVANYYSYTPMDVRNNYYIYNIDNVTYSGMGHDGTLTREEVRLFINTFIAAYRAGAGSAEISVENADVSGNASSGYFLTVDVDSENGDQILMTNDAQDGYFMQEQEADGSGFKCKSTKEVGQAKRVYFKISDPSSLQIKEFNLKFYVEGTQKELAVFHASDDTFIDHSFTRSGGSMINRSNYTDIFYVDVPITLEPKLDDAGNVISHAVKETNLRVEVMSRYKLSNETPWNNGAVPGEVNVSIMPRGLFDLD